MHWNDNEKVMSAISNCACVVWVRMDVFLPLLVFQVIFNMFYLLHNEIKKKGCISISFFDFRLGIGDYWNIPVKGPIPTTPNFSKLE